MDISRSHAVNFLIDEEKQALIPPFTSVAGLGETVGDDIGEKPQVVHTHLEQLKEAGAFGDLPDSSQFSLF